MERGWGRKDLLRSSFRIDCSTPGTLSWMLQGSLFPGETLSFVLNGPGQTC